MKTGIKLSQNVQRYAYFLTINNPVSYGFDHKAIKEILIAHFSTLRFFCMADEIGENGTYHTHIYVCFSSRVRFNTVKKHFKEAHIDIAHGTVENCIAYIQKAGKWENSEKAETRVDGTYEEWGKRPHQKGVRPDMEELLGMIESGYSNAEIIRMNNDFIPIMEKIDMVRTTLLQDKYKNYRRLDLKVIYISGVTGTYKTRNILDEHGDSNVYRVTEYQHPFDGYSCQPVIVFDEFRNSFRLSDMLNYCDIYPIQLPARYTNKFACYNTVYIVSNWTLEEQYADVQKDSPASWKAFLRRIHEVRIYRDVNKMDVYNSVDEYLNRDKEFHPMTIYEQENLPFN